MTRLIVLRHGETEWNRDGRYQGHLDSPLTTRGVGQAEAARDALRHATIAACYASDLARAVRTARIVAAPHDLEVRTDERLRERDFGTFQGRTAEGVQRDDPAAWLGRASGDPDHAVGGGESIRQVDARVRACADEIVDRHDASTVLLVAHGGVAGCLFRRALGLPLERPRRFALPNGGWGVITVGEAWRLEAWNAGFCP